MQSTSSANRHQHQAIDQLYSHHHGWLQRWLHNYTTASTDASNDVRARHPLREARIQVREKRGEPGRYYSIIQLQPHFQLDQMITTVKLVAELSPKQAATA